MASQPYSGEEVLTFERMRRAVVKRILDAAEPALQQGEPLDRDKLAELTAQEWKAAKEAVKSSPAARAKALEYMQRIVADLVGDRMKVERGELESLGIEDKIL